MKTIKSMILSGAVLMTAGILGTSCADKLELGPIDYYGSQSYWQNEAHVAGYIDGLHKNMRDVAFQHTIIFGELRGGQYVDGVSCDGMTTSYGDIRLQNFDADHTGVSNFGDIFGKITNCNLLIARASEMTNIDEAKKNYYLGIAYGLRAFYYFDLHRVYGGVPLRTDVAVIDGELDPIKLYKPRATPAATLAHVKSDIAESLKYFGNTTAWDPYGHGAKCYWNKAATECLAAEVYLWSAKVHMADHKANTAALATAKTYLNNVANNYGLTLLDDFTRVFDAKNKANDEIIFAIRFAEGEATNSNLLFLYSVPSGFTETGSLRADGTPWNDPFGLKASQPMSMEYKKDLYNLFDEKDTRLAGTFIGSYRYNDANELALYGVHTMKNIGYINSNGDRVACGDYIYYRLPWVYLSLAEVANMEGDNANVKKYIDLVRERAYGDNWDPAVYGYTAGDFTQNELAIFDEKNKEFVQEGQRWWDLLRMTITKGGDPLVFCKEGSLDKQLPLLDKATEAHKVLWPINKGVISNDSTIRQTPGYEIGDQKPAW